MVFYGGGNRRRLNRPYVVDPDQPQEVDEISSGNQPKATAPQAAATAEDELPLEKRE